MSHFHSEVRSTIDRWWHATNDHKSIWSAQCIDSHGHSIAKVWRIDDEVDDSQDNAWALKSWGWKTSQQSRLAEILCFQSFLHQSLGGVSSETGKWNPIPKVIPFHQGSPILESDSTLWTLSSWCSGQPKTLGAAISDSFLEQSSRLLAQLHHAGHIHGYQVSTSVGLIKRLECVQRWSEEGILSQANRWLETAFHRSSASEREEIWQPLIATFHHTLMSFHVWRKALVIRLEADAMRPHTNHWIIGDLWRENILVDATESERIRGLIDFGAARIDWAPLEVVRWFSSFLKFDDPRLATFLQRYNDEQKLLACTDSNSVPLELTWREFQWFDFVCTLTSLLQWYSWLIESDFEFDYMRTRVIPRIQELSDRLECMHCSNFPIS